MPATDRRDAFDFRGQVPPAQWNAVLSTVHKPSNPPTWMMRTAASEGDRRMPRPHSAGGEAVRGGEAGGHPDVELDALSPAGPFSTQRDNHRQMAY